MQSEFTITTTLPANVQADINNATDEQRQAFRDALDVHDEAARLYGEGSPRTKAASRMPSPAWPAAPAHGQARRTGRSVSGSASAGAQGHRS